MKKINYFDSNRFFKLFINFTTICNLNCKYCFARKTKTWNKEMDLNNINYLYDILKNKTREKFYLIWFGGEPLLHSKIDYIIEKFSNLEHQNIILSNGLLKIDLYKKILENNFVLSLTFHQNFKKFIKNIESLLKYKENITINILLENKHSESLYEFCIKNNIKYLFTQLYDLNEQFINPYLYRKFSTKKLNIELFQDKVNYYDLIKNHLKIKHKRKICFFNEGNIEMDLIYTDECRNLRINLKEQPDFFLNNKYKKAIYCDKNCGDCYGKIICKKQVL